MTDEEILITLTKSKEEIASLKHRVADLEEFVNAINDLAVSVKELAVNVSNNNERMDCYENSLKNQGERIGDLEKKPAKKWDNLSNVIVTALASGIVGFLLSSAL